ncbi:dentin sialophosphoprotein-like [Helianthus annuus]|uniref:dentin sialophosphoprotein-like n=1 Tax=Helianthus annuus TaxID=4232 RepID=UPI000B902F81|nr:dentin sialophosphoprotein-like [Helianthus annuus]
MNFVTKENENYSNESSGKSEQVNETEKETEKETKLVKTSTEETKESLSSSDSVDITNSSSSCAESVKTEEKSELDDGSHQSIADDVISLRDKHDLYVWNYVFSWFAETRGVPTKTDESGAVFLDYGCDENVLIGKSDVLTDKLETPVSSDSEISSGDSDNYSSVPETSIDTSETHDKDEKIDMFDCDNEEIDEQGSSHKPDNQMQLESSSVAPEESQTVSDIDCSTSDKPESIDVRDSDVDEAEEEISVETNSAETYEKLEPKEKESMEINSTVDSTDETEEEIYVETNSAETPENMFSEEKGSVEINSTDDSTLDPKGLDSEESVLNEAKSSESAPLKKNRSRKNRRSQKKKVQKENPPLKQTEPKPKLKGKVVDTYSCADNCEQGSSKIKHAHKQSAPNGK